MGKPDSCSSHSSDLQYEMDFSVCDQIHEFHVFASYSMYSMRWVIGVLYGYPLMDWNPTSVGIPIHLLQYAEFLGWFHTMKKVSESNVGPGWVLLEQIRS